MLAMLMTTGGDGDNLAQLAIKVLKGTGMGTGGVSSEFDTGGGYGRGKNLTRSLISGITAGG